MSTDSELKEAAERVRRVESGERGKFVYGFDDEKMDDFMYRMLENAMTRDLKLLAKAYLAQRADDAELVTEEWCRELLGKRNTGRLFSGGKWIPEIRGIDQWVRLSQSTTRGQLRQLLSALGVSTGGGAGWQTTRRFCGEPETT